MQPKSHPRGARAEIGYGIEVLALTGFAVAQPLLDIFGRAPEQFVFRGADQAGIVRFAVVVTLAPPLAVWGVGALAGLAGAWVRTVTHGLSVGLLGAAFAVQVLRPVIGGIPLFALAGTAGVGLGILRHRAPPVRLFLRYAAVAPVAFLLLFLFSSGTSRLLDPDDVAGTAAGIEHPVPVVVLVLDEFPLTSLLRSDGTIDAELLPNIADLAGDAHWFRNATTVSSSTWHAVPSLVTGRVPQNGTAPIAADHPENLFTLLGDGYDMKVTESVTRLCPPTICARDAASADANALFADALDTLRARLSWSGATGDPVAGLIETPTDVEAADDPDFGDFDFNQPARFRTLLDGITDEAATLHYLHLLLPHVPYRYLPSGARYEGPDPDLGRIGDDWADNPPLVDLGHQRLLLQVAYVDTLVGELVTVMRDRGVYDDALIVLTGDHGISFQAGGAIRAIEGQPLDEQSTGELLWVPLFVKLPGQTTGEVSDANVLSIDVLPTIADVLGVDLPWAVDGRSVFGRPRAETTKPFYGSDVVDFGVDATGPVDVDGEAGWRSVLAHSVDSVLPAEGGRSRLFRAGPRPELVGAAVDDLAAGQVQPVAATLEGANALAAGPQKGVVPALVRGTIDDNATPGAVAVVVNGTVGATAMTYGEDGRTAFAAVVDDALFTEGPNEVVVYRINA